MDKRKPPYTVKEVADLALLTRQRITQILRDPNGDLRGIQLANSQWIISRLNAEAWLIKRKQRKEERDR